MCCVEVCAVWRCVLCGVCKLICTFSFHFTTTHLVRTCMYEVCGSEIALHRIRTCFVRSVSFHFSLLNSHESLLNAKLLSPAYVLSLLLQ